MTLNEITEEIDTLNTDISEKTAEIKKYIKRAISYMEDIEDDDFIDGGHSSFNSAKSNLVDAEYAVDELIDDLIK